MALADSKFLVSRQRRNKQERIFCCDEGSMSEYISLVNYINTQNIYYMFKASPDGISHLQVPRIKTEEKQAGEDLLL